MKSKSSISFWASFLFLVSIQTNAASIDYIKDLDKSWDSAGFIPLAGSEWAQNNPGKLPYTRCDVYMSSFGQTQFNLALGGISSPSSDGDPVYQLRCYSRKYNLAYSIPLNVSSIYYLGVRGEIPTSYTHEFTSNLSKLNGKKVSQIFGTYNGVEFSLSALVGFSGHFLWNYHDVKFKMGDIKIGGGATFDYATISINPRLNYLRHEGTSDYLLVNGTEKRTEADWKVMRGKRYDNSIFYIVDYSKLVDLEFVKDPS